jgi:hypothetical protein
MAGWQPLSKRGTGSSHEDALYEGVPAHLGQSLLYWLDSLFAREEGEFHEDEDFVAVERRAGRIAARLRLDLRSVPDARARPRYSKTYRNRQSASVALVHLAGEADDTVLLDVIDATLADGVRKSDARELDRLLADGGSAWRVADDAAALERRVNPIATKALRRTTGTAASHLKAAWSAAYGRHPDPSRAYSQAIKAVETSYIPVVLPRDRLATLGKVIGELNQNAPRWQLAINAPGGAPADISTLLAMLRLLWQGQIDRHGGNGPAIAITAPAAEAAVHLAVTLVQWCESGAIQPTSNP